MPSQTTVEERHQDEARIMNLREGYADSFLPMYLQKMDGFLNIVAKDEKKFIKQLEKNKAEWKTQLKRLRPYMKEAWPGLALSPLSLCCQLLLETYYTDTVSLGLAYQSQFQPDVNGALFSAVYDYSAGFREILLNLLRAEIMTKNPDENKHVKDVQCAIEKTKKLWGTTPEIHESLAVYKKLQLEEEQFQHYLTKDSTGKQLLNYLVSLIRERTRKDTVSFSPTSALFLFQTSSFVYSGAQFAEKAYTALYSLAV